MKSRSFLVLSLAVVSLMSMASCTKNYTCHCNIKFANYPGLPDSTSREYKITDTESGAKSKCTAQTATYQNNNIKSTETCYLY